jgi:internalin A
MNLKILSLGGNQIMYLTPLEKLTRLEKLSLFNNQIKDLSPLSALTRLMELWLHDNQIDGGFDFFLLQNQIFHAIIILR